MPFLCCSASVPCLCRLQHWPFPSKHVMLGYAYILTHPGIPCLFWEHSFGAWWWGQHRAFASRMPAAATAAGMLVQCRHVGAELHCVCPQVTAVALAVWARELQCRHVHAGRTQGQPSADAPACRACVLADARLLGMHC